MRNEAKLQDEFMAFWDSMKDKLGLGEYSDEVTRFWIEKIKQSNLALLEEVEEKTREFPQIFGMDLIVSEDIKIDVRSYKAGYNRALDDFKSTLSKHKERLNK